MTFGTAIFIEGNITHMDDHVNAVFIFTLLQYDEKKDKPTTYLHISIFQRIILFHVKSQAFATLKHHLFRLVVSYFEIL